MIGFKDLHKSFAKFQIDEFKRCGKSMDLSGYKGLAIEVATNTEGIFCKELVTVAKVMLRGVLKHV